MKKKYVIVSIIVVGVLIWFFIWMIAYTYLLKRTDNSIRQGFINETITYLSTDETFTSRYGALISVESADSIPIENKTSELSQYYMDFTCITQNGQFYIRVYHTWDDMWIYSFEEINIE